MGIEIERKFLLKDASWRKAADAGTRYVQGYITGSKQASVRVRIEGDKAYLNIKGATLGVKRLEFEYPIPISDAESLLGELCDKPFIDKVRYLVLHDGHTWEIDVFSGDNTGLIVAEIELKDEHEPFARPAWLGKEVSGDPRYYNVSLVNSPYKDWRNEQD